MLFPKSAKEAIAKAFYDKSIDVIEYVDEIDDEGGVKRGAQSVKSSFIGNVRFNDLGELKTELGLVESIDICITCDTDTMVFLNDVIKYEGRSYIVTNVIPSDSHLTIVGRYER